MSIQVTCPNGHALKVRSELAGKVGLCPQCKARVVVPQPHDPDLSEDAILGILGHAPAARPAAVAATASGVDLAAAALSGLQGGPRKVCYKCNSEISVKMHICPNCHTYIAKLGDF